MACIFDGALGTESVATATVITGVPDPDMTWLMALEYFTWAADPAVYVYTQHTARRGKTLYSGHLGRSSGLHHIDPC